MRFVFFVHSAASDWNHGNAHFLRGLMRSLAAAGHQVRSYEPDDAWSVKNLVAQHGIGPVIDAAREFPEFDMRVYNEGDPEIIDKLEVITADADVVVVHEWNSARIVGALADVRRRRSDLLLLFHDTHHRAWSDPASIGRFNLASFDGALVFGEVLRKIYRDRFGVERSWTFHEAADTRLFRPLDREKRDDVVWIGNWGDGERTRELDAFWLASARQLGHLDFAAYGTRYPRQALQALRRAGVDYRGWVPSRAVPEAYAAGRTTLHIPRRAYAESLPGIPTIRVFEAMACGIPLISTPWQDVEGLFRPGDFAVAHTPDEMVEIIRRLTEDEEAAAAQAERGLATLHDRHTCDHRAEELLEIVSGLGRAGSASQPAERAG